MRVTALLVLSMSWSAALSPLRGDELPANVIEAFDTVDAAAARANVRFLADDLCEGRAPGTRGGAVSALYLATALQHLGIAPGGDDGTYFQEVPLLGVTTDVAASRVELVAGDMVFPMAFLDELTATDETLSESSTIDAPLVFAGYGIDAPERGWNDFKDADVAGKVLLVLVNDPPAPDGADPDDPAFFGGKGLTYYGRWTYKYEEAARQGAVGAICVHTDELAGYGWDVVRNSWARERPYVDARAKGEHRLKLASWVKDERIARVLEGAGFDLAALIESARDPGFRPVDLGVRVRATIASTLRPFESPNVIGVIPGRERPDEAVVYSAHYDHLGVRPDAANGNADGIYNGAIDNASGCAALLEIARMFESLDAPPARSIVFLFVTAEEGGLRGSQYYATHPTFETAKIAANVNIDGIAVDGDPLEYEALGWDRSTLRAPVETAAAAFGVALVPDNQPEQGFFYRSDHFSFAKVGVPAINLGEGLRFGGKPDSWGKERADDYRKHRYHQPGDEFDPAWDFAALLKTSRLAFAIGALVAEDGEMPRYLEGDEFERK
jgi:Zn-dependent M28 family amino/carboxypeptidase